jgi:serine/threonine protein kinase
MLCYFQLRSPEEYAYKPQTEKVDVYSLGNVLYSILTSKSPFGKEKSEKVAKKVQEGKRPPIPQSMQNSTDPFDQAMLKAINMCWIHDPEKRATARQVQNFITSELSRLGVKDDGQKF